MIQENNRNALISFHEEREITKEKNNASNLLLQREKKKLNYE
jgi:hypothetical protein